MFRYVFSHFPYCSRSINRKNNNPRGLQRRNPVMCNYIGVSRLNDCAGEKKKKNTNNKNTERSKWLIAITRLFICVAYKTRLTRSRWYRYKWYNNILRPSADGVCGNIDRKKKINIIRCLLNSHGVSIYMYEVWQ